jgi:predicted O-methyltransferase YrrM
MATEMRTARGYVSPVMLLREGAKEALRREYHRRWWAPRLRGVLTGSALRPAAVDTSHLLAFREGWDALGPVQRDEAFALFGLLRALRPRTVVEFGFETGRSAFNALRALDPDARLYAYDVDERARRLAASLFAHDPRLVFVAKSQADFAPADVHDRPVDFAFLDASHDFALNRATLGRLIPALSPGAIVAVHDTGTVHRSHGPERHFPEAAVEGHPRWIADDAFEVHPGERATVNWLRDEHPEFAQVHLHTHRVPRWGLTLLQRSERLATAGG